MENLGNSFYLIPKLLFSCSKLTKFLFWWLSFGVSHNFIQTRVGHLIKLTIWLKMWWTIFFFHEIINPMVVVLVPGEKLGDAQQTQKGVGCQQLIALLLLHMRCRAIK